jgi:hypothetical protein
MQFRFTEKMLRYINTAWSTDCQIFSNSSVQPIQQLSGTIKDVHEDVPYILTLNNMEQCPA